MSFKADEHIMETIWDNLPKTADGFHVDFADGDLELIWWNGFVDTIKFPMAAWIKAFEPHKQPNGDYLLTREEFLEKEKFRYTGEIKIPFDPLLINEGMYTEEGLQELIDKSIAPSCVKTPAELKEFFDGFKEKYRKGKLIRVDMKAKREINELIYWHPSPLRRLELLFDAIFMQEMQAAATGKLKIKATPEQAATVQMSTFTTMPGSPSEKAARELKGIAKVKEVPGGAKAGGGSGSGGVAIKKVRKSRKGVRG